LDHHIAYGRCFDRPGHDRQAAGIRSELAQEPVLTSPADDMHDSRGHAGHESRIADRAGIGRCQAVQDATHQMLTVIAEPNVPTVDTSWRFARACRPVRGRLDRRRRSRVLRAPRRPPPLGRHPDPRAYRNAARREATPGGSIDPSRSGGADSSVDTELIREIARATLFSEDRPFEFDSYQGVNVTRTTAKPFRVWMRSWSRSERGRISLTVT
jgi:hypothetical protein